MTGSVIDGEDVVQDVVIKAIDAFDRSGPIAHLEGWLFAIAHNVALNFLAQRTLRASLLASVPPDISRDTVSELENREIVMASLRTFLHLPVAQRASVILKDVLGYSLEEVSGITGGSIASIKANLHRGRAQLRAAAQEPDPVPLPILHEADQSRLQLYVDRFNARDFDAVRDMLADDVRLVLANAAQRRGRSSLDSYFGNYARAIEWQVSTGFLDRRPALLVWQPRESFARPTNFILLEWVGDKVVSIRDFVHARYAIGDAEAIWQSHP